MDSPGLGSERLLTIPETAEALSVSPHTVRRLIHRSDDSLPALRVGQQIRIDRTELPTWLFRDAPAGGSKSHRPPSARAERRRNR
jgi:excisionase family DNA binding protein